MILNTLGIEFSDALSILALLLSAAAYRKQYREELRIEVNPVPRPYQVEWAMKRGADSNRQLHLVTQWECTLINIGDRPASVIHIRVPDNKGVIFFNEKIYDPTTSPDEGDVVKISKGSWHIRPDKEIPLPISIAHGEIKRIIVKIGLPLEPEVQDSLQRSLNDKTIGNDMQEVFAHFNERGLSLFTVKQADLLIPVVCTSARNSKFVGLAILHKLNK